MSILMFEMFKYHLERMCIWTLRNIKKDVRQRTVPGDSFQQCDNDIFFVTN